MKEPKNIEKLKADNLTIETLINLKAVVDTACKGVKIARKPRRTPKKGIVERN